MYPLIPECCPEGLNNLAATGPLPLHEIYTDGFYFAAGYIVFPETLEINGRLSTVDGMFGDAWEYAFGVNIFHEFASIRL
ncbi:MAG: hypothetical protein HYV60_16170 [Planctomycetia bacterium]|nr:hypothetical protein [Planctomycetia bacterium]